jgi:hypothetical protein
MVGAAYLRFSQTQVERRNKVVHEGYFPSFDEALAYGDAVFE